MHSDLHSDCSVLASAARRNGRVRNAVRYKQRLGFVQASLCGFEVEAWKFKFRRHLPTAPSPAPPLAGVCVRDTAVAAECGSITFAFIYSQFTEDPRLVAVKRKWPYPASLSDI